MHVCGVPAGSSLPLMILMHHSFKRIFFSCLILLLKVMQACLHCLLHIKGSNGGNSQTIASQGILISSPLKSSTITSLFD